MNLDELDASGSQTDRYHRALDGMSARETSIYGLCLLAIDHSDVMQLILSCLDGIGVTREEMAEAARIGHWIDHGEVLPGFNAITTMPINELFDLLHKLID